MNETMLDIRKVSKSFGNKHVLKQVDLSLPTGSVLGLLGKNGSGKTTMLKCALGLQRPQLGEIHILGEPAWALSAGAKERLGYVPQKIDLYPWMNIRQIALYTGAFYAKWNQSLVDRLVREWELNPEDRVGSLSVGQTQKLAIILALGHEPELLILDEPAASLDPAARRQFLETVLDMVGDRTVIFSTHITSDLERVADRVAVLRDGQIAYCGAQDELKDSVKRLHVQAAAALPIGSFRVPGMLHAKVTGNEAIVSVQNFQEDLPERIAQEWSATVTVHDLNLEDIFLHGIAGAIWARELLHIPNLILFSICTFAGQLFAFAIVVCFLKRSIAACFICNLFAFMAMSSWMSRTIDGSISVQVNAVIVCVLAAMSLAIMAWAYRGWCQKDLD